MKTDGKENPGLNQQTIILFSQLGSLENNDSSLLYSSATQLKTWSSIISLLYIRKDTDQGSEDVFFFNFERIFAYQIPPAFHDNYSTSSSKTLKEGNFKKKGRKEGSEIKKFINRKKFLSCATGVANATYRWKPSLLPMEELAHLVRLVVLKSGRREEEPAISRTCLLFCLDGSPPGQPVQAAPSSSCIILLLQDDAQCMSPMRVLEGWGPREWIYE